MKAISSITLALAIFYSCVAAFMGGIAWAYLRGGARNRW